MLAIQVSSATCTGSIAYLSPLLTCMPRMLPEVWFDSKQTVVLLEADRGSTRSRPWFYSKYDSPTAIPLWHHGALEAGELSCSCPKAGE